MKKFLLINAIVVLGLFSTACNDETTEMDKNYSSTYDINYALREVKEYDPVNINGIDVYEYFDFFQSLRFTIHVVNNKMTTLSYTDADVPFSPFTFAAPESETECTFDTSVSPNILKLKSSGEIIAYFKNGELYIPFQLDCKNVRYEYRFKEIEK